MKFDINEVEAYASRLSYVLRQAQFPESVINFITTAAAQEICHIKLLEVLGESKNERNS